MADGKNNMVRFNQSGYIGCRMSERAKEAYEGGEAPLSKWSKSKILYEVKKNYSEEVNQHVRKWSKDYLASVFLYQSSWHHTGKCAQRTNFYKFDSSKEESTILNLTFTAAKREPKKTHYAIATWSEWVRTGWQKHPWKKVNHKSIAIWEDGGLVKCYSTPTDYTTHRYSTIEVVHELKFKAKKNMKIWDDLY